jgi:U6 snRNA-associated Sm-like protein LSm8
MSFLETFINRLVHVITTDGRVIVGFLRGFDQTTNIILESATERVYTCEGVEVEPLGLYILRGDNIVVVGEIDAELDAALELDSIKALPIAPLKH